MAIDSITATPGHRAEAGTFGLWPVADLVSTLERDELVLRVADNGCGFDRTTVLNGTGLASMKRRAERLGGSLTVRSVPGTGAVVECRIPLS